MMMEYGNVKILVLGTIITTITVGLIIQVKQAFIKALVLSLIKVVVVIREVQVKVSVAEVSLRRLVDNILLIKRVVIFQWNYL